MSTSRIITLAEFEGVYPGDESSTPVREGLRPIDKKQFDKLEELALTLAAKTDEANAEPILSLASRKGIGKVIAVRNYVGVIAFDDGHQIEVLPKTLRSLGVPGTPERTERENSVRTIFLRMLRETWDVDARESAPTDLRTARMPVFEAFIRMFLGLVDTLVKRGLPGGYTRIESDERFFKGKLLVAEHIRRNLVRKDRFFVAHDVFSLDNPANRILRSGLEWSLRRARHEANSRLARQLLAAFEDVPSSANLAADFASCTSAERNANCRKAIDWCRVFLRGQSISNLSGTRHAQALLFPMETIFERYVARMVRRHAPANLRITTQDRSLHLFEESSKGKVKQGNAFQLKPDIVLRRAGDGADCVTIADTKWKLLCDDPSVNYGISTGDMYQMYAYQKRYRAKTILLVYPLHHDLGSIASAPPFFRTPDDSDVRIMFFNLQVPDVSAMAILATANPSM
jgi:5-methylcytosine-specific restriction enzyme subunit McrC